MKKFSLAPVTFFTLTLTSLLLPYSGWFVSRSSALSHTQPEARQQTVTRDFTTEAAVRYRTAQPHHWRALMLRRQ